MTKRPIESDYTSHVAYTRALEAYCDGLEQPAVEPVAEVVYLERGGNVGIATRIVEIDSPHRERLQAGTKLYTAPQAQTLGAQQPLCPCKDRPADQCDEEWGPDCDLGNNEAHCKPAQQPQVTVHSRTFRTLPNGDTEGFAFVTSPEIRQPHLSLGDWLSAALEDPNSCEEFKQCIRDWFDLQAGEPQLLTDEEILEAEPKVCEPSSFAAAKVKFARAIEIAALKKNGVLK